LDFAPQLLDKKVPFFYVEPSLFLDYLDNKLNPKKGFLTVLSLKGMFPLSRKNARTFFVRLLCEQSFFVPMGHLVGALRIRFGHIFHRLFKDVMPIERFYLGGSHSLRSYDTDFAPPLGVLINEGQEIVVPRGGKSMF